MTHSNHHHNHSIANYVQHNDLLEHLTADLCRLDSVSLVRLSQEVKRCKKESESDNEQRYCTLHTALKSLQDIQVDVIQKKYDNDNDGDNESEIQTISLSAEQASVIRHVEQLVKARAK